MPNQPRTKGVDEIFCRSCGEVIKEEAEICPHCGVRNEGAKGPRRSSHDPTQFETTVSENWWYGIVAGTILWVLFILLSDFLSGSGTGMGFIVFLAWIGLPIAAYFDMEYVRANSEWNPNTIIWIILFVIWLVNIIAGIVYLYRRHEVLGVP